MTGTIRDNSHFVLTEFRGLSVNQATELRRRIRAAGGSYRVIKNRLAKRAAQGTALEPVSGSLTGPRALAYHSSDPAALAKVLADFAKENPQLTLIAGVVDSRDVLDPAGIKELASLPGLPELRAQLLALIQTPATTLVRLINTPAGQVARAIDARSEKLGPEGSE
jgi:large subunit ribosomal protein L10